MHPEKAKYYVREREALMHQLGMRRREFQPDGRFYVNPPTDRDAIKKKIADINHTLSVHAPKPTNPRERDAMWKEAKRLVDEIRVGMPNKYEMHPLHINPATGVISKDLETLDRAVKKEIAWQTANKSKIVRLKNIFRTLGELELCNIERLRPAGVTKSHSIVT